MGQNNFFVPLYPALPYVIECFLTNAGDMGIESEMRAYDHAKVCTVGEGKMGVSPTINGIGKGLFLE